MRNYPKRVLIAMADPLTRMNCAAAFVQAQWEVNATGDGREALRILREQPSDAMVLQLPLKVYDGLEVLRRIPLCGLYVCPGVVLSVHKGMENYAEKARQLGAAICIDSHAALQEIVEACANIKTEDRLYGCTGRSDDIKTLLGRMAFSAGHAGTQYLAKAIGYVLCDGRLMRDLAHGLYPLIAAEFGVEAANVERGIRHAIERAWSDGIADDQYALFENTIDEKRGKPTNGGMIARAAEILRAKEATL